MNGKYQVQIQRTESGFEISGVTINADTAEELTGLISGLSTIGIPVKFDGAKTETVTAVVRRLHVDSSGRETPVIDLYGSWRGDYGQWRFCGMYLNTPEDVREFEKKSGLMLVKLPVYDSQAPLKRIKGRAHKCEITCKPFGVLKTPDGQKEIDGVLRTEYRFAGYVDIQAGSENGNGGHTEGELKVTGVTAVKMVEKNGKPCVEAGGVTFWTREPFRQAGYSADEWNKPGTVYNLKDVPFTVFYTVNDKGFKTGVKVEAE